MVMKKIGAARFKEQCLAGGRLCASAMATQCAQSRTLSPKLAAAGAVASRHSRRSYGTTSCSLVRRSESCSMARTDRAKRVDPAQADNYAEVGRRLILAGRAILDRADPRHASALAILSVHAVIAYVDSLCVHLAGRKSTSADHDSAIALLRSVMGSRLPATSERVLVRVLSEKDRLEYQGYVATMGEAQLLFSRAERFATWAESVLTSTRRRER